jgi:hypothetical protein
MKLFRFDPEAGKSIDAYGSLGFVISKLVRMTEETDVKCGYLGSKAVIGYHQTTKDQLFAVVQGEGWVRGESLESRCPIRAGQAAFWERGEWHESGTEAGMVVILIEGEDIDPTKTMPPV